jgi:biotin transport system substrate-specific component
MKQTENKSFIKNSPQDNLRSLAIISAAIVTALSGLLSFQIQDSIFPFVMQNFFCLTFAGIFGGVSGAAITGLVLMCGALGLPVFSFGTSGANCLSGETGGFLIAYFISALFIGIYLSTPSKEKTPFKKIILSMFIGYAIIYLVGFFQYFKATKIPFSFLSLENLAYRSIPLFIGDFIKLIISCIATYFLRPICAKYFYIEKEI